ncbi:SubName: Full=Uncharacterized protein {ECO:0000313/EMBL:CCA76217.1} [Serendipita indica DSM 11827]|nr:SubName: Full=Uncharacterized protein {ECO:0000313/EMBL:CCA76217.1} [Serendipita indica DSM 11827]
MFVTLVFPEWVLGIAVLQFTKATKLAKSIRKLQDEKTEVTRQHGFFILMGGFHLFERDPTLPTNEMGERNSEMARLLPNKSGIEAEVAWSTTGANRVEAFGKPIHPLDEFDVCRLIEVGKLVLPTPAELDDKCKSDGLAKFLVIAQTLWFISQCIARKASELPLTELEVITLGYTLLTVAMYIAWWDKPYRVKFPIRVYQALPPRTNEQEELKTDMEIADFWGLAFAYVTGTQGELTDLRSMKRIPMFHSGYISDLWTFSDTSGMLTTIIVGMVFGTVHFLAWSSPMPSHHMQFLWRFATIVMTAAPPAAIVVLVFAQLIRNVLSKTMGDLIWYSLFLLPLLYLAGRGITIVLALVTLATLPLEAYRDVEWSDFFPHI